MKTKLLSLFILAFSFQLTNAQQWFYYKELPVNVVPAKITSNEAGTMYMVTSDFEVYHKPYGGDWNKISEMYMIECRSVSVDKTSDVVYVGTGYQGLFYSSDYGQDWNMTWMETSPVSGHHEGYSCFAQTNTSGTFFGGFNALPKVTLFTNFGATGQVKNISNNPNAVPVSMIYTSDQKLLVGTSLGIWLSTDDGNSFTQTNHSSGRVFDLTEDNNGRVYGLSRESVNGTISLIYSDDDINWLEMSLPESDEVYTTVFYDNYTESLWLGSREGIYKTSTVAVNWENKDLNNTAHSLVQIISDQNDGLYNFSVEYIAQKLNTSQSDWQQDIEGFGGVADYMAFNSGNTLFVTNEFFSNKVSSVETQEENWYGTHLGNAVSGVRNLVITEDDKIFANTTLHIYRSDNNGLSFVELDSPVDFTVQSLGYIKDLYKGEQNGVFVTHSHIPAKIFGTFNEGQTWEVISDISNQGVFAAFTSFSQDINGRFFSIQVIQSVAKIFTSTDGLSWELIPFDYNNVLIHFDNSDIKSYGDRTFIVDSKRVHEVKENEGIFSLELLNTPFVNNQSPLTNFKYTPQGNFIIDAYQNGVHQSFDDGVSWEDIGFPSLAVIDNGQLDVIEDYDNIPFIIIKEDNNMNIEPGIYYYVQNVVLSADEHTITNPSVIMHPNPVKTELFIQSEKNIESISVFDYSGKKVLSLNNQNIEKIDVSGLTQGIYITYIKDIDGNHHWSKFMKQ